jgi:hypothetical protein
MLLHAGRTALVVHRQWGSLKVHDFRVDLQADLGDRAVLDGDGRPAIRCAQPSCQ